MNFEKAKGYLSHFVSYEGMAKIPYGDEIFDLQRIKDFLRIYKVDYEGLKYIHVAGSKGKGSTCRMIANYLWKDGCKVGLYTSPHLFEVTERIWLDGSDIGVSDFVKCVNELRVFIKKIECDFGPDFLPKLSYFEILTVLALKYFVDKKVDYVVLEVGLGGRLDATNIVRPLLSILTSVELEHTDVLGDSIEKILREKLGIVKDGVPILIAKGRVLKKLVEQKLSGKKDVFYAQDFAVYFSEGDFSDEARFENAHLAFAALKLLKIKVFEKNFLKIAKNLKLPGVFDLRKTVRGLVLFDVAHTEKSVSNLIQSLRKNFPKKTFVFLFALMKGKNLEKILPQIGGLAEKIVFTNAHEVRGIPAEDLLRFAQKLGLNCDSSVMKDPLMAFKFLAKNLKKNRLLVVTGSHFLVGKLLPKLS